MRRPAAASRVRAGLAVGAALGGVALAVWLIMRGGWSMLVALLQPEFWR